MKFRSGHSVFSLVVLSTTIVNQHQLSHCLDERPLDANFIADAAERASPAVVNIQCIAKGRFMSGIAGGSGFIISSDGMIVTNAHVVSMANGGKVRVRLWNDPQDRSAHVHSLDEVSDIALLKLDSLNEWEELPVAKLGNSSALRAGEFVVALGSPLLLQNTVTHGIVSSTARHSSELGMRKGSGMHGSEYIQTDAPINVGNSGGPLINIDGEVIGINSMKAQSADGVSFAIPIDTAQIVINQLLKNKRVARPSLGIKVVNFIENNDNRVTGRNNNSSSSSRKSTILSSGKATKILIVDVDEGSLAQRAGLCKNDIIIELNGQPINGVRDLLNTIMLSENKIIQLTVQRANNRELIETLTLNMLQ